MKRIVVLGASNIDLDGMPEKPLVLRDSNIGSVSLSFGGVGHNIALNLALLGSDVSFITALGHDNFGSIIRTHLDEVFKDKDYYIFENKSGIYLCLMDDMGDMYLALNDMSINNMLTPQILLSKREKIENADYLILDANMSEETIKKASTMAKGIVIADCVSTQKEDRLISSLPHISILKPNKLELEYLSGVEITSPSLLLDAASIVLNMGVKSILVTFGEKGAALIDNESAIAVSAIRGNIKDMTGAGDSYLSAFCYALSNGKDKTEAMKEAAAAAIITAQSAKAVCPEINSKIIEEKAKEAIVYDELSRLF